MELKFKHRWGLKESERRRKFSPAFKFRKYILFHTVITVRPILVIPTFYSMSGFPVYPPLVHVNSSLLCPNPFCNIKAPHDYVDLLPVPSIPIGIAQLEIARFTHPNPFPAVNCWKLVSPIAFDPKDELWVYLSGGFGTVVLAKTTIEKEGWVIYYAMRDGKLVTRVALPKRRRWRWRWW